MSQTLYLYYTESLQSLSSQSHIQWCLGPSGEQSAEQLSWQTGQFSDLADAYSELCNEYGKSIDCTMILAVENLLCTQVVLPGKQAKHLKQALPFLIEEKLSIDAEAMHFCAGPRLADNRYNVIAIEQEKLSLLLSLLKGADIEPSQAFGDAQLLVPSELYIGRDRSLLSLSSGESIAVESEDLELLLNSAFNNEDALDSTEIPELTVNYEVPLNSELELQLQALDTAQSAQVHIASSATAFTSLLLGRASKNNTVNLLQGEFVAKKKKAQSQINWKPFAIAASAILALQLGYFAASGFYFNTQADTAATDTEKLYRQYFPQDRRILDIKRQAQAHLRGSNSSSGKGFTPMLSAFGESWKNADSTSLKIEQLRYNSKRSQMTLEVQAKSINQLDTLQRDISKQGIKAELMSANESDSGVRGRLQLGG